MTTTIQKQMIMHRLCLPMELVDIIKDYVFHTIKKIQKNDERYTLLRTIEIKEYDPEDGTTYVYLTINLTKDFFITYNDFEYQIQTFGYENNIVYPIDGHRVLLQ